ncbi:MAG: cytochrome c [Candidatus Kapabacteria bacterium]|nr:cytochrome c [Ignavibacteriota bacterium]MCW5885770.1 cytochrome c [Candidatus Kapabacteria bacterium]
MKTLKLTVAFLVTLGVLGLSLVQMSHAEGKDGKTIFEDAKCTTCHGIESQGVVPKKKSDKNPDLSKIHKGDDYTVDFWTKYLKKDENLNNKKHPVPFRGSDEDLTTMINWLMEVAEPLN